MFKYPQAKKTITISPGQNMRETKYVRDKIFFGKYAKPAVTVFVHLLNFNHLIVNILCESNENVFSCFSVCKQHH